MLALTDTAAQAVEAIVTQPDTPDGSVLRITTATAAPAPVVDEEPAPAPDLQLAVVEAPEEGDATFDGVAISVEAEAVDFLEDKVLDAEINDGGVKFSLFLQPETGSGNGGAPAA